MNFTICSIYKKCLLRFIYILILIPILHLPIFSQELLLAEKDLQEKGTVNLSEILWEYVILNDDIRSQTDEKNWTTTTPNDFRETCFTIDPDSVLNVIFRLRLIPETTFHDPVIGIKVNTWAAIQVYWNNQLLNSYGVIDTSSHEYSTHNPFTSRATYISIDRSENVMTLVFRGRPENFTEFYHWSQMSDNLIYVGTQSYLQSEKQGDRRRVKFNTIWFTILIFLACTFSLMAILNPEVKNLWLLVSAILVVYLAFKCSITPLFENYSYVKWQYRFSNLFWGVMTGLIPFLLYRILYEKTSYRLLYTGVFIAISVFVSIFNVFLPTAIGIAISLGISIYLVYKARKKIELAQSSIIVGLILTIITILLSMILFSLQPESAPRYGLYFGSVITLALPISMMIYVVLKFKSNLTALKFQNNEVLRVTQEKEKILKDQNQYLENQIDIRTNELKVSRDQAQTALKNLKDTQAQLIQSEKMASLGELTAGIAHEIQNPLNFVNNFSELSTELIDEFKEELEKGDLTESKLILNDLKENINKISHHGERASSIVRGMLDHSRTNTGEKMLTDINSLCDEYLRLAYHGLRAKDKSFNASFKTEFDDTLPKIEIVPQEMGRVLLNIINNAFHAVKDKEDAMIIVSTRKLRDKLELKVADNGKGISADIKDKIFQPFFTTKPSGQGTGLGLSLAYDIIKSHHGELMVQTSSLGGAEFVIFLPITVD